MSSFKPLNFELHSELKVKPITSFPGLETQQIVPVAAHEFATAGSEMPVVFVKNAETGAFQAVALLGLNQKENVFYQDEKWRGHYIPSILTHQPFALMPSVSDETQLQLLINEESPLVNKTEGEGLFDDVGNESEYLTQRKNALGRYFENAQVTTAFVKMLSDMGLLKEQQLTLNFSGDKILIEGVYLVDEKRLLSFQMKII